MTHCDHCQPPLPGQRPKNTLCATHLRMEIAGIDPRQSVIYLEALEPPAPRDNASRKDTPAA